MTGASAIFIAVAIWASAVGIGLSVVGFLVPKNGLHASERVAASAVVGAWLLHYGVWAVGAWRFDRVSMLALLVVCGLLAAAGWRRGRMHIPVLALPRERMILAVLAGLAVLALGMIVGALAPPADADAVRYHLVLPRRDLELGFIRLDPAWSIYDAYPALMEMLYRSALALANAQGCQEIHVGAALLAAAGTYGLGRRAGLEAHGAGLAAFLFLAIRLVMYQSATADIDQIMVLAFVSFLSVLLAWRESADLRLAALAGVLGAAVLGIKYTGAVILGATGIAVLILDPQPRRLAAMVMIGLIAVVGALPMYIHNYVATGNPVFPLYHHLFGADFISPLTDAGEGFRRGSGILGLLVSPLAIFLAPLKYDGPQFGVPYLLVLAPFAAALPSLRHGKALLAVWAGVHMAWFFFMPQMVRFLAPIFPVLAVAAAAGAAAAWSWVAPSRPMRRIFIGICAIMAVAQSLFFGGTALRRVPVALGLVSAESFLTVGPYRNNTHYAACRYLDRNLRPNEHYLSLAPQHSFYCPQGSLMLQVLPEDRPLLFTNRRPRTLAPGELAALLEANNVKFILDDDVPGDKPPLSNVELSHLGRATIFNRFDDTLRPALGRTIPVLATGVSRVYDARAVIDSLRRPTP